MADTTKATITGEWQKISSSDCTIQSPSAGTLYDVAVGTGTPTDSFLTLNLNEPATFAYKSDVWVRLHAKGNSSMQKTITVIK